MSTSFVSKRPLWHDSAVFLFYMCALSRADAYTGVLRPLHMMARADPADMMSKTFVSTRPPRLDVAATLLYTVASCASARRCVACYHPGAAGEVKPASAMLVTEVPRLLLAHGSKRMAGT